MPVADVKARLDKLVLALGADNTHAYYLKPPFSGGDAVAALPIPTPHGSYIHWAALGPRAGSFYLCFKDPTDGTYNSSWGDNIPNKLRTWLSNDESTRTEDTYIRKKSTRVALGPGNSFLAWDHESIRWNRLPETLEETLQSWITPTGWKYGPLVYASLGCDGAFYVVTSKGTIAYMIPDSLKAVCYITDTWATEGSRCCLQRVCFSPCNPDQFIVVEDSRAIKASCPAQKDLLVHIADYLYTPEEREIRRQARRERRDAHWCQTRDRNYPGAGDFPDSYDQENRPPREHDHRGEKRKRQSTEAEFGSEWTDRERKRRRNENCEPKESDPNENNQKKKPETTLHDAVEMWRIHCKVLFSNSKPIAFFPMLPTMLCKCSKPGCHVQKSSSALKACKHEVADVLRACEGYSIKWLRKERLRWHPDMFGRKCAPNRREKLSEAAGELFATIENILHSQKLCEMT